jgi:hypothetical protein
MHAILDQGDQMVYVLKIAQSPAKITRNVAQPKFGQFKNIFY